MRKNLDKIFKMKKTFQPVKFHIFFEQSFFSHELTPEELYPNQGYTDPPHPPPPRIGQIFMKDVECAE